MKQEIEALFKKALKTKENIEVAIPDRREFGHFSTNIALKMAKQQSKNPMAVAAELAEVLTKKFKKTIDRAEAVNPGFVNIWLADGVFESELEAILKERDKYVSRGFKKNKNKVQVEFVSANPSGPLTLANGRGGFLGDTLSNILETVGFEVEREYYVNDTGNQIITLGKSILARAGFIPMEDNFYQASYVSEWAEAHKEDVSKFKEDPWKIGRLAAKDFLAGIKDTLKGANINFDRFTSEYSAIHQKQYTEKALKLFKRKGYIYEGEGAVWLKTTEFSDDKDRVLVTKDGFPTYFLADAGHYMETKDRGFAKKINILGPDHYGYVARIQAAAKIIDIKESDVIVTQALRLMRGTEEVKMSKRKGEFITFEEVIEEVGADVARFFFLSVSPRTHMDFDMELAKEQSAKNPVYYAQYGYARASNILKKAKEAGISTAKWNIDSLSTPEDRELMLQLMRICDVVSETAKDYEVNRLARYVLDIARTFHNFYEKERIIGEADDVASSRLALVKATQIILGSTFKILGITPRENM